MIFSTGFLTIAFTVSFIIASGLVMYLDRKMEMETDNKIIKDILFFSNTLLFLLISLGISLAEGKFEDRLYNVICSDSQKEMSQVTCEKAGIKVIFDNGDIKYSFPDLKNQDSSSTQ